LKITSTVYLAASVSSDSIPHLMQTGRAIRFFKSFPRQRARQDICVREDAAAYYKVVGRVKLKEEELAG
jgi:hypothetical protein